MNFLFGYTIFCIFWSLYASRCYKRDIVKPNIGGYIRYLLYSPLLIPWFFVLSIINKIYNKLDKEPQFSFSFLRKIVKFNNNSLVDYLDLCWYFPFSPYTFSAYSVMKRQTYFTFCPSICGSFPDICKDLWFIFRLYLPWNKWAYFTGQRFIYCANNTKLLTDTSCRTRGEKQLYYSIKVGFGFLKIIETEWLDEEENNCNTFLNYFIGSTLHKKERIIYKGFVFSKKKAYKLLYKFKEDNICGLFTQTSFSNLGYYLEDIEDIIKYLNKDFESIDKWKIKQLKNLRLYILNILHLIYRDSYKDKSLCEDSINLIQEIYSTINYSSLNNKSKKELVVLFTKFYDKERNTFKPFFLCKPTIYWGKFW